MSKILLSGVPGTGKSTVAEYIEKELGYYQVDMERDEFTPRREFRRDPKKFMAQLSKHEDVLISWGFGPFEDRSSIEDIQQQGFTLVWLDGNRVASFREFVERENANPIKEASYYGQMQMIVVTGIVEVLHPRVVNPFNEDGKFKPLGEIAQNIINSAV